MIAFATSALPSTRRAVRPRVQVCATAAHPPCSDNHLSRRAALVALAAAATAQVLPCNDANAADSLDAVVSERYGYSFNAPTTGWTKSQTTVSGNRDLTLFVKDGTDGSTNISMIETPVAGDYKKLTSFGPMDTVLKTLVPNGQGGVTGEVISASLDAAKNAYVVEYKLQPSVGATPRHLLTVFSLQPGRFLLTLTAQTTEQEWESEANLLRRVADSYTIRLMD